MSKIQFEISASITGSFLNNDTLQVKFDAGGGHSGTSTQLYVWSHDDSASNSTMHSPAGVGAEATLIDGATFFIGSSMAEKSFNTPLVRNCEEIQILITGSHDRNPYDNVFSKPAGDLQFDKFDISLHQAKVEVTDKGILAFASPTRFIKADKSGVTLKGGSIDAQSVKTNQLEVYGTTAIFSDIIATDNSPYSGSMTNVRSGSDGGDTGLAIPYARGDHAHGLEASVVDNVVKDYELQRITASAALVKGDMTVSGTLEVIDLVVQRISSSVQFITGSSQFGDSASQDVVEFTASIQASGSNHSIFGSNIDLDSQYRINVNDILYVTSSGRVGIGTSTPANLLHLSSSGVSSDVFRIDNSKTGINSFLLQEDSDGDFKLTLKDKAQAEKIILSPAGDSNIIGNFSVGTADIPEIFTVLGNISASGRVFVGDGTEANPSIAFGLAGQVDTGLYRRSNNVIGFSAGGDGQMTLNESGVSIGEGYVASDNKPGTANSLIVEGRVGIGITNPGQSLEISSAEDYLLRLTSTDNKAIMTIRDNATTGFISSENGSLSLGGNPGVNANNLNIITSSGHVGIGTSNPLKKLQINFGSTVNSVSSDNEGIVLFNSSSAGGTHLGGIHFRRFNNAGVGSSNQKTFALIDAQTSDPSAGTEDGHLRFSTMKAGTLTQHMHIQNDGNVGIGTTSPTATLHISDASTGGITSLSVNDRVKVSGDGVTRWGASANQGLLSWDTGKVMVGGQASNDLELYANNAVRMIVKQDGNVGIGNISPANAKLVVEGKISASDDLKVTDGSSTMLYDVSQHELSFNGGDLDITSKAYNTRFTANTDGNTSTANAFTFTTGSSAVPLMVMRTDGRVGIGTSSPLAKLHIEAGDSGFGSADLLSGGDGGVVIEDSDSAILTLVGGTSNNQVIAFGDSDSANVGRLTYSNTKDALEVWTGGSQRAEFDDYGVKIIGDISASGKIIAQEYIVSSSTIYQTSINLSGSSKFGDTNDDIHQYTGSLIVSNSFMITGSTGKVGIGTLNPTAQLDVRGSGAIAMFSGSADYQIEFDRTGQEKFDLSHGTSGLYFRKSNTTLAGFTQDHDFAVFNSSGTRYVNFDGSSGKVHIGSNHTSNPAATLDVRGDISSSGAINTLSHITASGDISASGTITSNVMTPTTITNVSTTHITASGNISGSSTSTGSFGNIQIPDDGQINLGTGNDLKLYHTGNHSFIEDSGTGNLIALTNLFQVKNAANNQIMIQANQGGAVQLLHNNSQKFITNAGGVNITGHITASGQISSSGTGTNYFGGNVNVSGSVILQGSGLVVENDSATELTFTGTDNTNITSQGDLYIKAGSSKKMYLGADGTSNSNDITIDTNGKVGIGTTSPPSTLTVQGDISASNGIYLQSNKSIHWENEGVGAGSIRAESNSLKYITKLNGDHIFRSGSTDLFFIDSSEKKIGININNPAYTLDLGNNSTSEIRSHRYRTNNGYLDSSGADVRISSDSDLQIDATKVGIGTTTPAYKLDVIGDAAFKDSIGTSSFASGFTGKGWNIGLNENNKWGVETDDLTVRGTMNVYEMLINQTRATNGSLFVSSTGKVDTMSGSIGGLLSGSATLVNYPSANDLVLHYTFNENQNGKLYDFSPNKLHTTDVNGVKSGSAYSKFSNGSGLKFDDTNYVDIYIPTASLGLSPRRWTVSAWVNLADDTNNQRFLNFSTSSTSVPHLSLHHSTHPLLYLDADTEDYYVYGNQTITGSGWHHIAFVFDDKEDGASTADIIKEIYVDGLMATGSGPETGWGGGANPWNTTNFTDNWRIGHSSGTTSLTGSIDDFRVYKRALTGLEVEALYSASEGIVIKTGDDANHGFDEGDVIRAQRFTGTSTFQSDMVVTRVENTTTFAAEPHSVMPEVGFEYVRLGNVVYNSRQGSVYMTADDNNAPFIDIVDGITHHNDFNAASGSGGVKARLGKLTNTRSTTFGDLTGYGLYSDNVYLEGGIKATFGEIGGFGITSNALSSSDNTFILSSSTQDVSMKMGTTANAMTLDDGTGFFVSGSGEFRVGNPASDQLKFSGGVLQITSSQINLSGSGVGIDTSTFELDSDGLDISSTAKQISLGEGKIILSGSTVPVIKLDGGEISSSHFFVSSTGEMTASAGKVAGFDINGNTLVGGTLRLNADDNGYFEIGGLSGVDEEGTTKTGSFFGGNGFVLLKAGETANSNYIKLKNGELKLNSTNVDISGSSVNIQTPSFFFGSTTNNISSSNDDLSITTKNLTASGSSVEILTPNFFLGNDTTNISGSSAGLFVTSSNFNLNTTNLTIDSINEKIDLGGEIVLQAGTNPKISISGSAGNDTIKLEQSAGTSILSLVKPNHSSATSGLLSTIETDGEFKFWLGSDTKYLKFNDTDGLDILTNNAKLSGSNVEILTPSFMLGDKGTSFISSSGNDLQISSSAIHIQNSGQITGSKVLFKGGKIGGWNLSDTSISSTNIAIESDNERIYIQNATHGQPGVQMSYAGSKGKFHAGSATGGINFDGSSLIVSGTNIDLATPSFDLGDATTNISGSNGSISIVGNVTMSNSVLIDGGLTVGNLPSLPTEEGLMTYLSFNGGLSGSTVGTPLLDNSGNGRNTTGITGTPKFSDGIFGNAVLFQSESSDFIKIDNADFDFGRNDSFTLSVWAKRFHTNTGSADPNPDDDGDGHNSTTQAILTKGAYNFAYGIDYRHDSNTVRAGVRDQNDNTNSAEFVMSDDLLEWHHIVMTYTSASTIDLYVDGEFKSSDTIDHPDDFYETSNVLEIGGNNILGGNSSYYNGYIDEVRVYTGSLSKSQIRALYLNPGGIGNTTIAGDQISTGIIKSNTYSATEGTELDLNNATFKLGGSANPKLSWDGSDLRVSGSSTEILTPNFFFGSDASHISGSATGIKILTNEAKISGSSVEIQTDSYMFGTKGVSFISSSGTELEISSSNFDLRNGNVTASNVDLTGKITATSGAIGDFIIDSTEVRDSSNDLRLKSTGQITGSKVLFDGGRIGGFQINNERLFTTVSSKNSVEISSLSGSFLTTGLTQAIIGGESTTKFIVGSFGQTWRAGAFSGRSGIDIGTYKISGAVYKSLLRIDDVSQSIAGWNFNEDSIYQDNFYLSGSRKQLIVLNEKSEESAVFGSGSLTTQYPDVANHISNSSFENGLIHMFTSSAGHTGTAIATNGTDTLKKPSGHGNTRFIKLEVTESNAALGDKHYRIRVNGSAKTE